MRPRQVRYQAALRPDIAGFFILKHFLIRCTLTPRNPQPKGAIDRPIESSLGGAV
jgi:hypothetical protein